MIIINKECHLSHLGFKNWKSNMHSLNSRLAASFARRRQKKSIAHGVVEHTRITIIILCIIRRLNMRVRLKESTQSWIVNPTTHMDDNLILMSDDGPILILNR